ncbi:MAG: DUF4350 domain-containing protein [Flavobacteriaceae bacterium]|nr:DUF4350 domain-containing protein [Flavobacteriaceae bacterium]
MTKTIKTYLFILLLLFFGAIAIEYSKPKPINWSRTYNETHKIPFGMFIYFSELENLFPNSTVEQLGITPYEYFDERYDWENDQYEISGTYMYIDEVMLIDEVSAGELLNFASEGNSIFISSTSLPETIQDSLGISTDVEYNFSGNGSFSFANKRFANDSISLDRGLNTIYFSELDSINTTVLGYQRFNFEDKINFIKVDYGQGAFFLHLQPIVFTNYNLLKNDHQKYTAGVSSYLKDDTIYFDSRNKKRNAMSDSPMRFILSNPALKWAWFLALISLLVFVIFNAKRKQRIVKIIKPNENTTVAFTKTIGNLYYETKDHNNVIEKKITYFLEYIRRVYFLDTQLLDEKFTKHLALKSGRPLVATQKLINLVAHLRAKSDCNEDDLLNLNRAIEDFHNN